MRESSQSVWMLVSVLRKTVSDVPDPSPEASSSPPAAPGDCCTQPASASAAESVTAAATTRCVLTAYLLVRRDPPGWEVAVAGPEMFQPAVMADRAAPRPYRIAYPCPIVRTFAQDDRAVAAGPAAIVALRRWWGCPRASMQRLPAPSCWPPPSSRWSLW